MTNFILGYINCADMDNPEELTEFNPDFKNAINLDDFHSNSGDSLSDAEEWCRVAANSLNEAKENYHKAFEEWKAFNY